MASHGVPRTAAQSARSEQSRQKELKDIESYQKLVEEVNAKVGETQFTPELLQKTAELLKKNPEYYTIWNYRRRIFGHEFNNLIASSKDGSLSKENRDSQILDIIELDRQFLLPLLIKFPKCYWIWNHRLWLLDQSRQLLSVEKSRELWTEELGLVAKMLSRDNRNFHGWGYRRTVVKNLEELNNESMAKQEFDYTTKMISTNLSNFSAWHNRSRLIVRILEEQEASDEERKQMLDDEIKLIHKAFIDPYDQSLWFYHQNLMSTFDPRTAEQTLAPNLSKEGRKQYLAAEREFVEELLEDAEDCKWIYQELIEILLIESRLDGNMKDSRRLEILEWINRLKKLDPLRMGRWNDLQAGIGSPS